LRFAALGTVENRYACRSFDLAQHRETRRFRISHASAFLATR